MIYKFRAEADIDVLKLGRQVKLKNLNIEYPDKDFTHCVVEFESDKPLGHLIAIASLIEDCHVIAETIELKENYTGER